jgi:putative oxidoreductase
MNSTTASGVKIGSGLSGLYSRFAQLADYLRSPFLLLVRLYWGWQYMQDGWGKLHHLGRVTSYFASLGIPAPGLMTPAISALEFVGGILLILGLGTRLTGLLLAGTMFMAYVTADRDALGSILSSPDKFYNADPFTYLFAAVIALVFGAGLFSLDAVIARKNKMAV